MSVSRSSLHPAGPRARLAAFESARPSAPGQSVPGYGGAGATDDGAGVGAGRLPGSRGATRAVEIAFYGAGTLLVAAALAQAGFAALADMPALRVVEVSAPGLEGPLGSDTKAAAWRFLGGRASLVDADLPALRRALEGDARLTDIRVERQLPGTLVIRATRREPAGLLSAGGFHLIDADGRVMQKLAPGDVASYSERFPFLTGLAPAGSPQPGEKVGCPALPRALDAIRLLRERNPELFRQVSDVNLQPTDPDAGGPLDCVTLHMKDGLEVRLGDRLPAEALPALDLFLGLMRERGMPTARLAYVDLRFDDRIFFMDRAACLATEAGVMDDLERAAKAPSPAPAPAGAAGGKSGRNGIPGDPPKTKSAAVPSKGR